MSESAGRGPYDARTVANTILDRLDEIGSSATQLQLYKMLYFAHGWSLALNGRPLVSQQFEAWNHGPVIGVVRDAFKKFGSTQITDRAEKLNIFTGEFVAVDPLEDEADREFIYRIVDSYHSYDGWHLSELTHEQGSPWDQIWNSPEPVGKLALRLDDRAICSYFVQLPRRFAIN